MRVLPYFDSRFAIDCSKGVVDYSAVRTDGGAPDEADSLDYWLTERYCLYSRGLCSAIRLRFG